MNRPFLIVLPVFLSGVVLVRAPGNPASMAAAPATTASIPATGPATLPAIVTVEPSVDGRRPAALQAPFHIEASGSTLRTESHSYVLDVKTPGVHKLVVTRLPARKDGLGNFYVFIMPPSQKREWYWDVSPDEHHFYPVLTPGQHEITVRSSGGDAGDRYRLSLLPDPCEMTESLKADAKAAIDRGVAVLLKAKPAKADYVYQPAMEALVMAALAEGEAKKDRAGIVESDYLAWFEKRLKQDKKGTWAGQTVSHFGTGSLYEESIITLGLAQAASSGSAKAKALARTGSTYLLASQLTARRCPAWGAIQRGNIEYGGWRYTGAATNADISVTGWCIVALLACDAAGVDDPALRQSLEAGTDFVKRCLFKGSFAYTTGGGATGDIRNAIGALVLLLMGEEDPLFRAAMDLLDRHLPAGTQTLDGENYPLYYGYYGTRVNYLRGGRPWDTWRSVMIRQLVRLQKPDGSWTGYGGERILSNRYATALSVMILRMCINDVPAYLRHEARGF